MITQAEANTLNNLRRIKEERTPEEWEAVADKTFFSDKQFFVAIAGRYLSETELAEIRGVKVGTIRSDKGRIKKKREKAGLTAVPMKAIDSDHPMYPENYP
jgi:hypothetical protein